ncbi:MAG TPA: glucoamylase family protein [Verrucomicrobiae bacterium]|nr:glucoamylase family protein [Verrucomicrobiae bacterium]
MWLRTVKHGMVLMGMMILGLGHCMGNELLLADFDNHSVFNHFSGDSGTFTSGAATIRRNFDTNVFRGPTGASLRVQYSVGSGFCGVWESLMGKVSFAPHTLNFTNLHGALRSSAGHPSRVENIRAMAVSFWARGDGSGGFDHRVKLELKSPRGSIGDTVVEIPNDDLWRRYDFGLSHLLQHSNIAQVKELVWVFEDIRNEHRPDAVLYLDDVTVVTDEPVLDPSRWVDDAMLDAIAHRTFSYFLRFTDSLGFALDRSTFSDMVSVGTVGFQLTAYCIGHERQWAERAELEQRVRMILRNLRHLPTGPEPGTGRAGYRGFFYHFLTADTGLRKDANVELSVYDTALLMYGVLTCLEYFSGDAEIRELCQQLYDRVEWSWFVDRRPGANQNQFRLEWKPEGGAGGRFQGHVDGQTDEALMLDILALGSRTYSIGMDTYFARRRSFGRFPGPDSPPILASWRGSMFNYFFASCWLNFERRGMDLHALSPVDLWRNNRLAIEANRRFCMLHAADYSGQTNGFFTTYGENAWGLTACDNLVAPTSHAPSEYFGFGALPTEENLRFNTRAPHAGTIAVYGAVSAINYTPQESLAAIRHFLSIPKLWNPLFGFGDAFSLDPHYVVAPYDAEGNPTVVAATHLNGPWINPMVMGVNVGPMLLAVENYRTRMIWKLMDRNPHIRIGLDRIFGISSLNAESVSFNDQGNAVVIRWKAEREASRYAVYGSSDLSDWRLLEDGIQATEWTDTRRTPGEQRFYLIKALR